MTRTSATRRSAIARLAATAEVPAPALEPKRTTSVPPGSGRCRSVVIYSSLTATPRRLTRAARAPTCPVRQAAPGRAPRRASAGPARAPAAAPLSRLLAIPRGLGLSRDLGHQPAQVARDLLAAARVHQQHRRTLVGRLDHARSGAHDRMVDPHAQRLLQMLHLHAAVRAVEHDRQL